MGDVINLRIARKSRSRSARAEAAAENRAKFGRTKSEKSLETLHAERSDRLLDGHRMSAPDEPAS